SNTYIYIVQQKIKRILDLSIAFLGLIFIMPAFSLISIAILLDSPGPIFQKTCRIGKGFKPFYMYKFRTMYVDSEELVNELLSEAEKQKNTHSKICILRKDPSTTRLGKFLRTYSLENLPQLINVLIGDMSFVGPIPLVIEEKNLISKLYRKRFNVLPGMTGAWQIDRLSNYTFEELCKLELLYVSQWNLFLDLRIILMTIPKILFKQL
nr:sugar transferase [Vampirovibrio sp.]